MIAYTLVDALTDHIFEGAPCAVCMWDANRSRRLMSSIATELAVPDTVFLMPNGPRCWYVYFFNPLGPTDMSAHALLAAAYTVLGADDMGFFEGQEQTWRVKRRKQGLSIVEPVEVVEPCAMPDILEMLSHATPVFVGQTQNDWWVECRRTDEVDHILKFDQSLLKKMLVETGKKGLVLTAERRGHVVAKHVVVQGWRIIDRPIAARAYRALLAFWAERLHVNALQIGPVIIDDMDGGTRLTAPCVEAFVGSFLNVQGQIHWDG